MTAALIGSACERTLDFVNTQEEQDSMLTLDAIAVEGEPLIVYLSGASPVGKNTSTGYYDYGKGEFVKGGYEFDYQQNHYYLQTHISHAIVTATVNGQEQYELRFDYQKVCYVSDYLPKAQDRIEVKAVMQVIDVHGIGPDGMENFSSHDVEARAETVVPAKPRIEVLNSELLGENPYRYQGSLFFDTDSIMRLTCRISDTGGERYYRLRVRSERCIITKGESQYYEDGEWKQKASHYYIMQDVYFSSDNLFVDSRLTSNFGGWPAFFSNTFDNSMMQGRDYTVTVDSPLVPWGKSTGGLMTSEWKDGLPEQDTPPRVMVELQAISKELYLFVKSLQLYQISSSDAYAEPVQIYSNVQNGWGIFGALSYDRHFVEYGE